MGGTYVRLDGVRVHYPAVEQVIAAIGKYKTTLKGGSDTNKGIRHIRESVEGQDGVPVSKNEIKSLSGSYAEDYRLGYNTARILGFMIGEVKNDPNLRKFASEFEGFGTKSCREILCPDLIARLSIYGNKNARISSITNELLNLDAAPC